MLAYVAFLIQRCSNMATCTKCLRHSKELGDFVFTSSYHRASDTLIKVPESVFHNTKIERQLVKFSFLLWIKTGYTI